jgi:hypothetical protein
LISFVLSTLIPEGWASDAFWLALISIPMTLAGCSSLYGAAWTVGEREYNLVKHGHLYYDKFKGLKAGLIAMIPGLLLALIAVAFVGSPLEQRDAIGLIAQFLHTCLHTAFYWLEYITSSPNQTSTVSMFLPVLAMPIMSAAGFALGYRGIYLRTSILYRKKNSPDAAQKSKR